MELIVKNDLSTKQRKQEFYCIAQQCFPITFDNENDLDEYFEDYAVKVYYDKESKKMAGFISYYLAEDTVYVAHVAVSRGDEQSKGFQNQGVATKMITDLLDEYNNHYISLDCAISNQKAKNLYYNLGFQVNKCNKDGKRNYYTFVRHSNKELNHVARVLHETYNFSKIVKNQNLDYALGKMFENKYYDNIYQYNMSNKDIDNVIKNSALFPLCLCLLDQGKRKYHEVNNYNVKGKPDNELFKFIKNWVKDLNDSKVQREILNQLQDNDTLNNVQVVFDIIENQLIEDKLIKQEEEMQNE